MLRGAEIRFDFRRDLLTIRPGNAPGLRAVEPDTILVEARRRAARLLVTDAEVDGQRVTVVLDTRSQLTIGNLALRNALARRGGMDEDDPAVIRLVTGERVSARYGFVRNLEIGGLRVEELGIAFAEAHIFTQMRLSRKPALLLGMNALRAFDSVSIDMTAKKLRFKVPDPAAPVTDTARRAPAPARDPERAPRSTASAINAWSAPRSGTGRRRWSRRPFRP